MKLEKAWLRRLLPAVSIVLVGLAVFVIHGEISSYSLQDIKGGLGSLPSVILATMAALTILSYFLLSSYDAIGLEYAGERLPYRSVLLASFMSYALSNNVGHAMISGGSLRYRLYTTANVSWVSIARVILFCSMTYLLGALTVLTFAVPAVHFASGAGTGFESGLVELFAATGAAFLVLWWGEVLFYRKPLTVRGISISLPTPAIAAKQLAVGTADVLVASLVLYLPVYHLTGMPYGPYLVTYLTAQLAGLTSQVPGGLGIFEASFLYLVPPGYTSSSLLAALTIYRVIYYFLPLLVAGVMLVVVEVRSYLASRGAKVSETWAAIEPAVPQVLSVLLLIGGGVLLFSGATPGEPDRLEWLHYFVPLPLIEFSHLVGSIAGVSMLFLSRAVWQRLDSAYYAALLMLGLGALASLAKGWDSEEAVVMFVLMALIIPARAHFYRKSSLLALDFPPHWIALFMVAIGLSVWLGFFSYRHVEYSGELWWQFALHGDASRFIRSLVATSVLFSGFTVYRFLTRPAPGFELPSGDALDRAEAIVLQANETAPHLALLGDKYLLWSASGASFIMFDKAQGYWVAMGNPVGNPDEFTSLEQKFRDTADLHSARVAYYQVSDAFLTDAINMGLTLLKLGEEAHVPLQTFGLEGTKRQGLRHAHNKHIKAGHSFEIIPASGIPRHLPVFRTISDSWLTEKRAREKRFSLGFFDDAYLRRCDVAVVRQNGKIVAFSNIWKTANREELSMDLMRYESGSSNGVMEFLIIELMLWGRSDGYQWFNLGMAPLSGLENHPLAPLWHKIGNTIFRLGNEFYNFDGLLRYKKKFDPVWRPRYLAAPAGLHSAQALLAATSLISQGLKGTVLK